MKNIIRLVVLLVIVYLGYNIYQQNPQAISTVTTKEAPLLNIYDEKEAALEYLNSLRKNSGMVPFYTNEKLEQSAQNHAKYLIKNDKIGHFQIEGKPEFTGIAPAGRAFFAGYKTHMIIENVSSNSPNFKESIDGLMSAIYHRFGFLDFQVDEIGIGVLQDAKNRQKNAYVYNMGIYELNELCQDEIYDGVGSYVYNVCKDKSIKIKESDFKNALDSNRLHNKKIAIYPYDGQTDVPPAFFDEIPDPLPEYEVSGFPLSISFNEYYFKKVKVLSFKLFDTNNKEIKETKFYNHIIDPNSKFKRFEFALFPLKRLEWDARYRTVVEYIVDGEKKSKEWYFHTKKFKYPLYVVNEKNRNFEVEINKSYIFYFEPTSKSDILGDLQYPLSLDISFIDRNTVKLVVLNEDKKSYKLKFGEHKLNLYLSL